MRTNRANRARSATSSRDESAMAVLRDFRVIYGSVRHHFRKVERLCGFSGSQLWILQVVDRHDGIGVSELANELGIHQSTCSQLVEKLVKSRHLAKNRLTDDQRRVGLAITTKGKQKMACAPGPAQGVLPHALGELSSARLKALHRSLQQVIGQLDLEVKQAAGTPLAAL